VRACVFHFPVVGQARSGLLSGNVTPIREMMSTSTLPSFTDEEKTALRLFCNVCDQILECRFVKDLPNQDHSIRSSRKADGSWDCHQPVYDRDDFRSYMTLFRKLLMQKEPTHIYHILRVLARHVPDEERAEIKKIKKGLRGMERHGIAFNLGTDDDPDMYSPRRSWDVVINSEIFHSDTDQERALQRLRDFGAFFETALVKFVTDFSRQAIAVSDVIKHRNYFA